MSYKNHRYDTFRKDKRLNPNWLLSLDTPGKQTAKDKPKNSQRSMKWQPQERLMTTRWTKQHLDAYLALAEVICEWNIEPG
jgi:hypothetical protein